MSPEPPPPPDMASRPSIVGQTVVEVMYSPSHDIRGIITVDSTGLYRVCTEYWDTSDWDIARIA